MWAHLNCQAHFSEHYSFEITWKWVSDVDPTTQRTYLDEDALEGAMSNFFLPEVTSWEGDEGSSLDK